MRWARPLLVAALVLVTQAASASDSDKQACVDLHASGQALRRQGKLVDAAKAFSACARPSCPRVVQGECGAWLSDVESTTPTVVFDAVDGRGTAMPGVSVSIDGARVVTRLDGRAVRVDPGEHSFVFETDTGARAEQRVLVLEGERNRKVRGVFVSPSGESSAAARVSPPARASDEAGVSGSTLRWPVVALGVVGVAGLAGFATFGILGNGQRTELDACRGACTDRDYDVMRDRYLVADVSLGVGLVALGAAAALWLTSSAPR